MNALIHQLEEQYSFSEEDIMLINKSTYVKAFRAGDYFLEAGAIANQIGFVVSGVFRFFFYDKNANEITSVFLKESEFVTNLTSFFEYLPCSGSIQAETDAEIILIDRKAWEQFCQEIPNWEKALRLISDKFLIDKINFQRSLINQDAATTYLHFVSKYPTIIQRVPLGHIASFLGITQSSLSRIRKQLAKKDFLSNDKK
ncbi:Crp/Fnr family transcriptional regulator [Flavobacterium aestivum]|uniref:Crp/Fnr family transcriptional regulator n=1 Tax=Flavobacterium aestivum TaxID=3003257 RepID=UPI00248312F9|nr:Crp/Fnr family transcriptional regulator [Flavobacterium aestivum]